ncbi:MAG TPA: methyltransferase domain-containing protein [Elusimicrobiota bacterium]|nr:methyltransferase domain-containing protein [Elusimicrobiota bacterium]
MSIIGNWLGYSVHRRRLDKFLFRATPLFHGHVIDIGGTSKPRGKFRLNRSEQVSYVTRINISAETAPDIIANAIALPCRERSADTVLSTEVLEYVDDPARMISECLRCLKPNGQLIISAPFTHRVDHPSDRWRYSRYWFEWQFRSNGVSDYSIHAMGGAWNSIAHIVKTSILKSNQFIRPWLALLTMPLIETLTLIDDLFINDSDQSDWTTGYFCIARKPGLPDK